MDRTGAALPPDVRHGYASPFAGSKQMGLRPWSGLRPKVLKQYLFGEA
jgi:hypothetical protein